MIIKKFAIVMLFAFSGFTSLHAAEPKRNTQQQQPKGTATVVPADKQQSEQSAAEKNKSQEQAKPSMVDYCREHTC